MRIDQSTNPRHGDAGQDFLLWLALIVFVIGLTLAVMNR